MMTSTSHAASRIACGFELRFRSLFHEGRGLSFDCAPDGSIDLDRLSERARLSSRYARALIGREFAYPEVRAV